MRAWEQRAEMIGLLASLCDQMTGLKSRLADIDRRIEKIERHTLVSANSLSTIEIRGLSLDEIDQRMKRDR